MDHRRSSEAGSQTDCSQAAASGSDVSQRRQPSTRSCPGSKDDFERMYVLRNCDRCQDYTVTPCHEGCHCAGRGTHCSGQCADSSQESLPRIKIKSKPSPKASVSQQNSPRGVGGHCPRCQICGKEEIHQPGQNMCPTCNKRIHEAVETYYVQCQGQCQSQCQGNPQPSPSQQPSGGHWQQINGSSPGDQPFNIIVLQDCQNQQQLIEQLSSAMNRSGGQVHIPQPPSGYSQNNMGYANSYSGNPLSGYIDYEYLDFNRGYEQERYDYGYDMDQGPDPGAYSSSHSYVDDRFQTPTSCTSYDCPIKNPDFQKPRPDPGGTERMECQDQAQGFQAQGCTCNCEFCRKGFETKEKLAMLIAQALEIFVLGRREEEKKNQDPKPNKKKNKKKRKRPAAKAEPKAADCPCEESNRSKSPKLKSPGGSKSGEKVASKASIRPESPMNTYRSPPRIQEPVSPSFSNQSQQSHSQVNSSEHPPFFLPNCEEHRCKYTCRGHCSRPLHDCSKGCKDHCRGYCSKSGGGDGNRKRGKNWRKQYQPDQRHNRCHQCNPDEGRQWQEMPDDSSFPASTFSGSGKGCAGCSGAGRNRTQGGGAKSSSALLGLSPIAHYRPGMMQFPVNYLLAGTNYRRRLVRTAAGVTLHQKPYVAKAEAKDLPNFPCRKESSLLDCRTPPPAKKWL